MTAIPTAARVRGLTAAQWLLALLGLNAMWVTDLLVMDGGLNDNLLTVLGRATGLCGRCYWCSSCS